MSQSPFQKKKQNLSFREAFASILRVYQVLFTLDEPFSQAIVLSFTRIN
jgi:hypothetical protein